MTNNSNIEVALVVEVNGIRCKAITFDDMNKRHILIMVK